MLLKNINCFFIINNQEHPYFLVTPSIIPVLTSISALFFVTEIVNFFYFFSKPTLLIISFITLIFILFEWFFNVALESDYHTKAIQYNNKISFMLFIVTEIMFFFSLFWAFFHGSLSPAIAFDNNWPPQGLVSINAFGPPIWGTWVLWMSSIYALYIKDLILLNYIQNWVQILRSFNALLILAFLFTICQLFEFYLATFSFREGLYGSVFYLLTGFHGIHVIIGTIFIMICWIRYYLNLIRTIYDFESGLKNFFLTFYSFFKVEPIQLSSFGHQSLKKSNFSKISEVILFSTKLKVNASKSYTTTLYKHWWQPYHFSGLETGIWYWQFVDIVWIFVWVIIYVWGNNSLSLSFFSLV